jgi:hypothetical protein
MGIDSYTGAAAVTTPESEQPQSTLPPSGPRSSRVTINVRTPSRLLDGIPSSPASPTRQATSPAGPINAVDTVHLSVEESEVEMARDDTAVVTPISEEGSPPVEIISIESEDGEENGEEEPEVRIIQEMPRSLGQDPMGEIPFFDTMDPSYDVVNRLLSCFFSRRSPQPPPVFIRTDTLVARCKCAQDAHKLDGPLSILLQVTRSPGHREVVPCTSTVLE